MNRSSVGLAVAAGLMFLMLTFAGVVFAAGAVFLALDAYMSSWLAAVLTGGVLLVPLLALVAWLWWDARRRRLRKQRRLEAAKRAIAARAVADPYGFVCAAFMAGVTLSHASVAPERVAEFVAAVRKAG